MVSNTLIVVSGMAFEARAARGNGIRTIYGLDPAKLISDMEQAIADGASALLSFGTCAGLLPSLAAGSIVVAQHIIPPPVGGRLGLSAEALAKGEGGRNEGKPSQISHPPRPSPLQGEGVATDAAWTARLFAQFPSAIHAPMASVDHALTTVQQKTLLHATSGAVAADMESHHVARLAQKHKLPFAVLRIVLDSAHCALPPAALAAANPNGSVSYRGLIGSLLAHPQQLPALLKLSADHATAKKTLLRCGQLLQGSFGMNVG